MSQILTQQARTMMQQYAQNLAKSCGIQNVAELFNVSPAVETKLRAGIIEAADFLKTIHVAAVEQIEGQVVAVGVSGIHTGRKAGGRFVKTVGVGGHKYKLTETDSCAAITWEILCQWANQGDRNEFMKLISEFSNQMFALDIIRVGWNGVSAEETTDPIKNPLGQDVNVGWQQFVKEKAPSQIMDTEIYFDPAGGGDYKTLDSFASNIINTLIDPVFRNDPRLTVFVGSGLVSAAQYSLYNEANTPTEHLAAQRLSKDIAGRPAYTPPFFPENGLVITIPKNLQVLTQRGTSQSKAKHEDERKAFEKTYWRQEGYAVGELKAYAGVNAAKVVIGSKPPASTATE